MGAAKEAGFAHQPCFLLTEYICCPGAIFAHSQCESPFLIAEQIQESI